jgi:hypothetical protein
MPMKAREFFRQVQRAERELKLLKAKVQHFEDLGLTITSHIGGIGSMQRGASKTEASAVGIVDSTADLNRQIQEYTALIARAEQVIRQIPQEKYRQILTYRYLCQWSFRSISDELHYNDPNSVYRAHGWALTEAQKVLNREEKRNDLRSAGKAE